jgi:hypothetical protein
MKRALLGTAFGFIVLSLVGGYGFNWSWTGFSDNGTLWDWLSLCLLPITLGLLPLAFELSTAVVLKAAGAVAVVLGVLLVGGYGLNWTWTGFRGNTLWDWLHLMLVPVALPFVAHELGERQKKRKEQAAASATPDQAAASATPDQAAPDQAGAGAGAVPTGLGAAVADRAGARL